jgi:isocitrate dehydrogenase
VTSGTTEEETHSEKLRKNYKGAFEEWALQVSRLQAVSDGSAMKEAQERAAAAEIAYRDSRDRLMDDMGWTPNAVE